MASIPLAAIANLLRLEQLFLVVFAAGTLTALFEVAYHAYLPTLIARDELVEGNSKLEASGAVVEVVSFGPGRLAGPGADRAAGDRARASFVRGLGGLPGAIRANKLRLEPTPPPADLAADPRGRTASARDPVLRAIAGARDTYLAIGAWLSMYLLFLARDLRLEPVVFGLLFAIGGLSARFLGRCSPTG